MATCAISITGTVLTGDEGVLPKGLGIDYVLTIPALGVQVYNTAQNVDVTQSAAQIKADIRDQAKQLLVNIGVAVPANNEFVIFGGPV